MIEISWSHTSIKFYIHSIYPFIRGAGADSEVSNLEGRILYLSETDPRAGIDMHDVRYYYRIALNAPEILKLSQHHPAVACGDGIRSVSEACDDGNIVSGDGCNANCSAVEIGWVCAGGSIIQAQPDICRHGTSYLLLNFEEESSTEQRLRTLESFQLFENFARDAPGEWHTTTRGVTKFEYGSHFARSGSAGMRVSVRNKWETCEYTHKNAVNDGVRKWSALQPLNHSSHAWTTANQLKLAFAMGDVSSKNITLARIRMRLQVQGEWCKDAFLAGIIDGDTIFAYAKHGKAADGIFRDSMRVGPVKGKVYSRPLPNPTQQVKTEGWTAWSFWNSSIIGNSSTYFTDIDVLAPFYTASNGNDDISDIVNFFFRSTGNIGCPTAKWSFTNLTIDVAETRDTPFRPDCELSSRSVRDSGAIVSSTTELTWFQLDVGAVPPSAYLAFSFKVARYPQYMRMWGIYLLDANVSTTDPFDPAKGSCKQTTGCDKAAGCTACREQCDHRLHHACNIFYRICYSPAGWMHACEETHHPTLGVWHDERIDLAEKMKDLMEQKVLFVIGKICAYTLSFGQEVTLSSEKVPSIFTLMISACRENLTVTLTLAIKYLSLPILQKILSMASTLL